MMLSYGFKHSPLVLQPSFSVVAVDVVVDVAAAFLCGAPQEGC